MNDLQRTLMTISCRDCDLIPKVPDAGRALEFQGERVQIMHNGIKVIYGGYYGDWMAHVIRGLCGHHEPQEELIFHTLLRYVRNGSLMVELGAYWAYYTQWYLRDIPDSVAVCVEPDANYLAIGKRNSALNATAQRVRFVNAWVGGDRSARHSARTESSAEFVHLPMLNCAALLGYCDERRIELLHMDIQGAELPFLRSIDRKTALSRLRFVMASTHHSSISGSKSTHLDCVETLRELGATILVEHDVVESFSGDGLILASTMPEDRDLWFPSISRNRAETSLFKNA